MKILALSALNLLLILSLTACSASASKDVNSTPAGGVEASDVAAAPAAAELPAADDTEDVPVFNADAQPAELQSAPDAQANPDDDGLPEDLGDLIRCETKIEYKGDFYTAEAIGPTIEEARDNSIDETCAIPCADTLSDSAQDSEREEALDKCMSECADISTAIAAQCWQHGESIYTEGAWSATNDAPPTNGAEN